MLIDLVQLRTFVVVAEEQHLTRASERLHISLSAASAHVRAVEDNLGTQLFVRTNRSLELTRAGHLIFAKAKHVLNEATLLTSFAREIGGAIEGQLVVGSDIDPASSRIAEVIAAVHTQHPAITVDLRVRQGVNIGHGLKTGELDVGLLLGADLADSTFAYYRVKNTPFCVAGPAAWKERIQTADWAELARMPWVEPADRSPGHDSMMLDMFEKRGLKPIVVGRFENAMLGAAMAQAGIGLVIIREELAARVVAEGRLVLAPIARTNLPLHLAHLAARRNDPLIHAFLDAAQKMWPAMGLHSAAEN